MSYKQESYGQLGTAISLVANAFAYKTDKQGMPYILHCLYVMENCSDDPEVQVIGVLHDILEDTDVTMTDLEIKLKLTHRQKTALIKLTHNSTVPYDDYIRDISTNVDAVAVKLADLRHNSDILRLKGLRKKDFDRLEKYHRAFVYLSN